MKILAFEFSSDCRSVAAFGTEGDAPLVETLRTPDRETGAFALLGAVLGRAGWKPADVTRIAVGLGPGSYTGIRVAIAIAQAWQLAHGTPVVGLRSVDGLAVQALAAGTLDPVTIAINAHRGEFYLVRVASSPAGVREIEPLHLETAESVAARVRAGERVVGPGLAGRCPGAADLDPEAGTLARLAVTRGDAVSTETLEPIYLRTPQFRKAPPPRVPPPVA